MALADTLETIAPLGHTIIALDAPPTSGANTLAWAQHINAVSGPIEQKPVIVVVPFADLDAAQTWADQTPVKTSYRFVVACYPGATDQLPQIAASVAAVFANSNDPAVPFNKRPLPGLTPVSDEFKKTFERYEAAQNAGVMVIHTGADGVPQIMRALSTYRVNPTSGAEDTLMLDINAALIVDYVRKLIRSELDKNPRRKNTAAVRRDIRSQLLSLAQKLETAEIIQDVELYKDELTVTPDATDEYRVNVRFPARWVRGLHVVAATIDVY